MYTLYHQDGTRSGAALLVLEEGDLDYDLKPIDITTDEHRRESFLAVNPRGLIPTLVTDSGEIVSETAAIMMYLADRHRLTELAPLPHEPGRGVLHDWLFYHVGEVQEAGKRQAYANRYSTNPAAFTSVCCIPGVRNCYQVSTRASQEVRASYRTSSFPRYRESTRWQPFSEYK